MEEHECEWSGAAEEKQKRQGITEEHEAGITVEEEHKCESRHADHEPERQEEASINGNTQHQVREDDRGGGERAPLRMSTDMGNMNGRGKGKIWRTV